MSKNTMLVEIQNMKSTDLFVIGGTDDVVARIEKEARSVLQDVTTPQGRKNIASNAAKVARSKTYLDGLGKDLVAGLKQQTKAVDQERRKMRERLDALKAEIRKPLTDFEEREQARVDGLKIRLAKIESMGDGLEFASSYDIEIRINQISAVDTGSSKWMEFAMAARVAKQSTLDRAKRHLEIAKEREEQLLMEQAAREEAEQKQIRAQAEARRDREEKIRAQDAEAKANKAAADAKRKLNAEKAKREQAEKTAIEAKAKLEAAKKQKERQEQQKRQEEYARAQAESEKKKNRKRSEIEALNSLESVVGPKLAEILLRSIIIGNIRHIRFEIS